MTFKEYLSWFRSNFKSTGIDHQNGVYTYSVGDYSFTTKTTKSHHLSVYDITAGSTCVASRVYWDYSTVEDTIFNYLRKKLVTE